MRVRPVSLLLKPDALIVLVCLAGVVSHIDELGECLCDGHVSLGRGGSGQSVSVCGWGQRRQRARVHVLADNVHEGVEAVRAVGVDVVTRPLQDLVLRQNRASTNDEGNGKRVGY